MSNKRHAGFTILELSFVIVIIAVITGMGIASTLGVIETARRSATDKKMDAIEDALRGFVVKNNRLPCPSDLTATSSSSTYNMESQMVGSCIGTPAAESIGTYSMRGGVPTKTLGLPDSYMYDGWGRKIVYSVDRNTTYENAFVAIDNDEFCELEVSDTLGNYLTGSAYLGSPYDSTTGGAAYVLLSYGENGHGAYTQNGVVNSSGSTDADELQNCRCNSSGAAVGGLNPRFIQKDKNATYDDIVRYKEPWQLQIKNTAPTVGPDMAISLTYGTNTSNNVKLFQTQCGRLAAYAGTPPTNISSSVPTVGMNIFQSNSKLIAYNNSTCYLYQITKNNVGPSPLGSTGMTCSTYSAGPPETAMSVSRNGYVAITKTVSPYVDMWKIDGDYAQTFSTTSPAVILSPALASMPTKVVLSRTGKYLALTRSHAIAYYTYIYIRTGERTYTKLTDPIANPVRVGAIAFSRDEKFLAMSTFNSFNVRVWSIGPATTLTELTPSPILSGGTATTAVLTFSPDGRYIAMAGSNPTNNINYNQKIYIFKINGSTFTAMAPSGKFTANGSAFTDIAFSPDSNFLVLPTVIGANTKALVFRRSAVNTFSYHSTLDFTLNSGESPLLVRFRE